MREFIYILEMASKEFYIENPLKVQPPKAHTKPNSPITMEDVENLSKAYEFAQEQKPHNRCAYRSSRPTKKREIKSPGLDFT